MYSWIQVELTHSGQRLPANECHQAAPSSQGYLMTGAGLTRQGGAWHRHMSPGRPMYNMCHQTGPCMTCVTRQAQSSGTCSHPHGSQQPGHLFMAAMPSQARPFFMAAMPSLHSSHNSLHGSQAGPASFFSHLPALKSRAAVTLHHLGGLLQQDAWKW